MPSWVRKRQKIAAATSSQPLTQQRHGSLSSAAAPCVAEGRGDAGSKSKMEALAPLIGETETVTSGKTVVTAETFKLCMRRELTRDELLALVLELGPQVDEACAWRTLAAGGISMGRAGVLLLRVLLAGRLGTAHWLRSSLQSLGRRMWGNGADTLGPEERCRDLLPLRVDWEDVRVQRALLTALSGAVGRASQRYRAQWRADAELGAWALVAAVGLG